MPGIEEPVTLREILYLRRRNASRFVNIIDTQRLDSMPIILQMLQSQNSYYMSLAVFRLYLKAADISAVIERSLYNRNTFKSCLRCCAIFPDLYSEYLPDDILGAGSMPVNRTQVLWRDIVQDEYSGRVLVRSYPPSS
jgi:hypothetical protein